MNISVPLDSRVTILSLFLHSLLLLLSCIAFRNLTILDNTLFSETVVANVVVLSGYQLQFISCGFLILLLFFPSAALSFPCIIPITALDRIDQS